jgi:hypothetical protein
MHVGLICMVDRWALSPLAVGAAPIAGGGKLFLILRMPHMIPGTVHEWSSLCLFVYINGMVSGVDSLTLPFHNPL